MYSIDDVVLICSTLLAGIIPFGIIFVEMKFILASIWENQLYHRCGSLFVTFCLFLVSNAQISVLMTYFRLCREVTDIANYIIITPRPFINCLFIFPGLQLVGRKHLNF